MNEDEQSGFPTLVSAIAVCGFALLVALTAPWSGPLGMDSVMLLI